MKQQQQPTSKSSTSSERTRRKPKPESPWKKRLLYAALVASITASFFWIIGISINYWIHWVLPEGGLYQPHSNKYLEKQYGGLWKRCKVEKNNDTNEIDSYCTSLSFYPTAEEIENDPETDQNVLYYRRSATALGIIGIIVMVVANLFSYYSILEPRYVFKRLAGCLQIGCSGCVLVCVEIFQGMIDHEKRHLPRAYPPDTEHQFGFCFFLAWFCLAVFLVTSVVLFVYSRKRKNEMKDDRPIIIGRV